MENLYPLPNITTLLAIEYAGHCLSLMPGAPADEKLAKLWTAYKEAARELPQIIHQIEPSLIVR